MRSALSVLLVAVACGGGKTTPTTPAPAETPITSAPVAEPAPPPAPMKPITNSSLAAIGLDPDALDRTADPCTDFYQFACGGWMAKTEIPADKPLASRSFEDISDRNLDYEHGILEAVSGKKSAKELSPAETQLASFYGSCMDTAAIDKIGIRALQPLLGVIARVTDGKSLTAALATLHNAGFDLLVKLTPSPDGADATKMIGSLDQGGLGLPDRAYYLVNEPQLVQVKDAYQGYIASMLTEIGHRPELAKREAADILGLETAIAQVHKDKVLMRDPKSTYNKLDRDGVIKAMPHVDWTGWFAAAGLKDVKDFVASAPEFLAGVDALVASTKAELWRTYLTFHLVNQAASLVSQKLEDTRFAFIGALTGQKQQQPRWKRCVQRTDGALGDLLGQVFVRDRFPGGSKEAAETEVQAIVAAMKSNLDVLPWMDARTKVKAFEKLSAMTYQIGYPKKWRSYAFKLDRKTWAANALAARTAQQARAMAKIGKPVDKDDWQMTAPTVNAYYDPTLNGMVFPAGILQSPFYNVTASIPVNLGGMGMVVGHELTHGFDDQGAQYDALGNLVDWWQPETKTKFKARTECVADQYSAYEVSGVKLDGKHTLGENIADIGGIKLALTAYRSLRASAPETVVADGFTEDQQFFLAVGQTWCTKMSPQLEKLQANTNEHSPPKWRVDGALSATPDFAKVFRCKAGAKMVPRQQCVVW